MVNPGDPSSAEERQKGFITLPLRTGSTIIRPCPPSILRITKHNHAICSPQERAISNMTETIRTTHRDFLATLLEFYTLLDDLAVLQPDTPLRLPPTDTGVFPPAIFNADAASAAGYNAEAVSLLSLMPQLDVGTHEMFLQLRHSTYPVSYLGSPDDMDEVYFAGQREMINDEEMPPSAIRLTWEEGGHGRVYIYDVETKLMTCWQPWDDVSCETNNYFHVSAKPPREVLQPLIDDFRQLNYLGTPEGVELNDNLFLENGRQPPDDWQEPECRQYRADHDVWAAVRKLKDVYLECGWDVDAVEQRDFRRGEYLEKRAKYWEEVVKPLQEEASRVANGRSRGA